MLLLWSCIFVEKKFGIYWSLSIHLSYPVMKWFIDILKKLHSRRMLQHTNDKQYLFPFHGLFLLNWGVVSFRGNWRQLVQGGCHTSFMLLYFLVRWSQKNVFLINVNNSLVRDQELDLGLQCKPVWPPRKSYYICFFQGYVVKRATSI